MSLDSYDSVDRPSMKMDQHPEHNMPAPEHDGVQLAGDVIPLKGEDSMGPGPTLKASGYYYGTKTAPGVKSILPKTGGYGK